MTIRKLLKRIPFVGKYFWNIRMRDLGGGLRARGFQSHYGVNFLTGEEWMVDIDMDGDVVRRRGRVPDWALNKK